MRAFCDSSRVNQRLQRGAYHRRGEVKCFTGALTQSIAVTLRDFRHAFPLYELDESSMVTNFALALGDPSKDFFLTAKQAGMSFEDVAIFMLPECNSNSRQIQVRRMLDTMRIDLFMATHAVTKVYAGDVSWRQLKTALHAVISLSMQFTLSKTLPAWHVSDIVTTPIPSTR